MQMSASLFFHIQTLEHGTVPQLFHHKASQKTESDTTAPGQVLSQVLTLQSVSDIHPSQSVAKDFLF
jgi:hypothetical protein